MYFCAWSVVWIDIKEFFPLKLSFLVFFCFFFLGGYLTFAGQHDVGAEL